MPFVSKKQARFAFTKAGKRAFGGEKKVKEWAHATDYKRLPERARKSRKTPKKTTTRRHLRARRSRRR